MTADENALARSIRPRTGWSALAELAAAFRADRRGLSVIETALVGATIALAAATAFPMLEEAIEETAENTTDDFLDDGSPQIPDHLTAYLSGVDNGDGLDSTRQVTGRTTDLSGQGEDTGQGSRRYYNSDTHAYVSDPAASLSGNPGGGVTTGGDIAAIAPAAGSTSTDTSNGTNTGTGELTGPNWRWDWGAVFSGSGGSTSSTFAAPFEIDFSTLRTGHLSAVDNVANITGFSLAGMRGAIRPPELGRYDEAEVPGEIVFERVDLSTLTSPTVTLTVSTRNDGMNPRHHRSPEYLDIDVSYDGGGTWRTIASYEGRNDVMRFDATQVDPGGATTGPDIEHAGTDLAIALRRSAHTAIIRLTARASSPYDRFFIHRIGIGNG